MVATRSGTSAAGINLPPVHSTQKGIDPTLKPKSQSKSQQTLLKPTPITPSRRKVSSPIVGRTPAQTPTNTKLRSPHSSAKVTPRSLLNTPVQSKTPNLIRTPTTPTATQNIAHQEISVRNQLINKTPISAAQAVSRKLVQKSVNLLNGPRSRTSDNVSTSTTPPINLFPSNDTSNNTGSDSLNVPQLKTPIAPMPKLSPQQALLPQENLFDINSELIPYQDKEVEAVFKAPECTDICPSKLILIELWSKSAESIYQISTSL